MSNQFAVELAVLEELCTQQDHDALSFSLDVSHHETPDFLKRLVNALGNMFAAVDENSIATMIDRLQATTSARFRSSCLRFLGMIVGTSGYREAHAPVISTNLYRLVTLLQPPRADGPSLKQQLLGFLTLCSSVPTISKVALTNSRKYVDGLQSGLDNEPSKVNVTGSHLADAEYPPINNAPAARGRRRILLPNGSKGVVCTSEEARKAETLIERMRADQKQEQLETRLLQPGQTVEQEFDAEFEAVERLSPTSFIQQWKSRSAVENSLVNPLAFSAPD